MSPVGLLVTTLIGYFLGSLPFGYLVARAYGVDIFKVGSGNPGATNVKRVLGEKFGPKGKRAGNLVFVLDAVKGAVAAAWPLLPGIVLAEERLLGLAGLIAAVLGHSFSCFTKFKGGKGVATAAGGLVVLMPVSCLVGALVWLLTFATTRYVSLGSILAAVAVPATSWFRLYQGKTSLPFSLVATALGLFVIIRHRENIKRLLAGTETKFVKKSPPAA
ncbi:Glycerol-3-phosphate acyltransferase [Lacunisphaera limnophila]|uniref:Glycerol-3-phosphate acyltransferase n=1 Tax=Lacunisphaera limnophila TaxID=1838286 RepID=A0A1D8AXR9_9BACT|nr:glycerol-3-phosphate 1-O-acyltransferase PlsY [Lacunisphaera limnophila]AOS45683.1 Glycerol-3-phosphate acyltransferase [Lacunisphaera limnophila]